VTHRMSISPQRRHEILDALRRGTVPQHSLDAFAVGLDRFRGAVDEELGRVRAGGSVFKAVRGEYGAGKTFFARWLQEHARQQGFAAAEVQVSETETPLHQLETVYRRLMERMSTASTPNGALREIVDAWFYALEEDVLASGAVSPADEAALLAATNDLMEKRLASVTRSAPMFAAALRGYRTAVAGGDAAVADGILAWVAGQPNVAQASKRAAGVKGDVDHFGALSFLQGFLVVLRDSGHAGLVLVLDEVETIQRVRGDVRDKGLNALRQLIDEVNAGRFPGLYLLITGTPAFYEGPQGVRRLEPLAQRLHTDFKTDAKYDSPRAVQIRLPGFSLASLAEVGRRVRDIYAAHCPNAARVVDLAGDDYIDRLAQGVTGSLGGKVGIAPRLFLKKLVADVLDRIDLHPDFDPRRHYQLTVGEDEMTTAERNAAKGVDDVELSL
jgi:hypothetical protein